MGLFKLTPTEAIDRELARIDKEMSRYTFNRDSFLTWTDKVDPTIAMFNELLSQRRALQETLTRLAIKKMEDDYFDESLD